jgi:hypothetical protein
MNDHGTVFFFGKNLKAEGMSNLPLDCCERIEDELFVSNSARAF